MDPSSHVLGLPTTLCWPRRLCCRGRKDCVPVLGSWLLIWLSLAARPARSSPQGLGPRLLEPLLSELRFSNTTGASLNCAAAGQPPPRVTWLREGAEVEPLEGLLILLPNGTLRFPPFAASQFRQEVHGTTYRCRAENIFGAVLSTEVRVRAVVEQYYEVQVYDEFTIAGNTAVLRCHVPSFVRDDVVVVSWEQKIADKANVVTNGGRMSVFPSGELQVRRVQQSDASTEFRCRTWHRLTGETKLSSYGRLVVTDLKVNVPPRITNVRSSVVANEGDSVELPCAAQGYPPPKYLWERLTTADNASPHHPVVVGSSRHEPSEGSLLIRKVEAQDAGKYLCLVTNAVGEERATITLDVRSPVEARLVPEVLTAHVGQPASLRCVAAGQPTPLVRWYKDARELLDDGARVRLLDDRRLVQLTPVAAQDGGIYQCMAYNVLAQAQASAQLILGDTAPVLLESPKDSKVKPGDSLLLKCEATGSPAPKITWNVDGIPARHMKSSRVDISEASHGENHLASYVNISRIRTDEAGVWRCVAVNSAGAAEATARVAVRGPPAVRPFGSNRTAVATETLEMHCALLTYPLRSLHWEKDGRKLPFHHRQKVFANGTLLVLDTTVQDAGKYTCVAANEEGQTASASLHVAVKVPPLIERFAFDENLHEGMRTRVYCNIAHGDPPVRITWLRDGQPIKSGPGQEVRVLDPFSVALAIDSLSPSHDGSYTCVASNAAATVNYTAPLRVHVPPHWIKEPAETSAVEGHSASMDCVADGHPTPRVTWHRGVEPSATEYRQILSGPDYQVFENGTLRVAQVRVSDRGSYLCQASNGVGTGLSTVITLNVHVPARFDESYRNQTVQRGHSVGLECRASGDAPITISWSRNGRRLDTHKLRGSRVKNKSLPDGLLSTLSLPGAQREHSGIYVCEVANNYGQDETHIRLIVQEPPEAPPGFNVTSVNSRSASLTWGEPYNGNSPILSYLIQYKNASASWSADAGSRVRNVSAGRDQTSWTVRSLQPSTAYHLRSAAVNALGVGPFTEPPLLITTDEEVPGGPPTHVSVQTLGPQSLKVTWKPPVPELRHGRIRGYYVGYKLHNSSDLHLYKTVESRTEEGDDPEAAGECVLSNLRKFTKYSVLVQAYNAVGAGPRSDEVIVYTAEDVPQVAPSGVHCSASSATSLRVSWALLHEKSLDGLHKGYRVLYKLIDHSFYASEEVETASSQAPSWTERDVPPDATSAVLAGVEPFRNYSVRVAARTGAGTGAFSEPVHCSTPEDVPEAPADIKALVLAPDAILISWLPPPKAKGVLQRYTVYSRVHAHAPNQQASGGVPARPVSVPSSQFWHETRGLRTGQRYEFWVTASTGAGEGPATRIVTQSPEVRAPARIASFSREVSVALKQDLELPCRTAGQPTPVREWRTSSGALRDSERVRVLPSGTLHIEAAEARDAANYSCHAHNLYGRDAVHYAVRVHVNISQKSPRRPASVSVLSTTSNSITLGWLNRNTAKGANVPKVKEYEVHYKRQQGSWDLVRVAPPQPRPGGDAAARDTPSTSRLATATHVNGSWLAHELSGLSCGTQYHIYVVAVADRGRSEPSDTVFARTQGGVPTSPKREAFVTPNASSLTLRPSSWASGPAGCPVSHLAVEYRPRDGTGPWTVASRALQPREGPMTLHHLRPDTWYNLRVTAHTEAGTTSAEYAIRTLPASATLAGTVLPELMVVNGGGGADGDLPLLVPIATSLSLALAAATLVLGYVCCRRRAEPAFAKDHEGHPAGGGGRSASNDTLAESALVKRSSIDNVLSTLTSASGRQGSSCLASPGRHSVVAPAATPTQGSIDDISGYAPFPETQIKSRIVLKKTQEQPVANTRTKRPFSIHNLAGNDDAQKGDKGAEATHTPTAQFNHYDNPKATKAAGCTKKWQHPAEKGSRPYVIPQENKSTLEMETEGDESPRWSRSRRSNSNFANSGSTMVEKTYFFSGEELRSDVQAFCVALSPRMAMEYASEEIKFS
ncbi:cell adhesion molecule Dscam1-like isoform X1 [Dermacentor andersoni]|uniref:cell adhesion molecule Dscam1-like isoform X1 n=1 Tax=Dermacentor andersoni TaxID=34620 RepID=UPI002415FA06|nr:cell adhesion molecule Dscam2-like isoform X1 [Dermacentor andersoni]